MDAAAASSCPRCKTPALAGHESCPTCGAPLQSPPSEPTVAPTMIRGEQSGPTRIAPERGSADTAQVGIRPGRRFGHYVVVRPIARGGMGVVFLAHDEKLDRDVALKVLLAGDLAGPEELARFRREALAAGRLRHPYIVPIHDVGQEEGWSYIAMEYVDGRPLHLLLREKKLSIEDGVRIVLQVSEGIAHAHKNGVIHRDLKPANVLVDHDGNARLTDFGLAKMAKGGDLTEQGTTLGTPNYMPPEQARGHIEEVDERSDVYSLGASLYDVLTGRPPFAGETTLDTLMKVIQEPVPSAKSINPQIPAELDAICMMALSKEKTARYPSAKEFAAALEVFLDRDAASPAPQFQRVRRRRPSRRRLRRLAALASTVLALGVVLGIYFWPGKGPILPPHEDAGEGGRWTLVAREDFTHGWPTEWTKRGTWSLADKELVGEGEGGLTYVKEMKGAVAIEVEFVVDRDHQAEVTIGAEEPWFHVRPRLSGGVDLAVYGSDLLPLVASADPSTRHVLRVERAPLGRLLWWDKGNMPDLPDSSATNDVTPLKPSIGISGGRLRLSQIRLFGESDFYRTSGCRIAEVLEAEGAATFARKAYEAFLAAHAKGSLADEAREGIERCKKLELEAASETRTGRAAQRVLWEATSLAFAGDAVGARALLARVGGDKGPVEIAAYVLNPSEPPPAHLSDAEGFLWAGVAARLAGKRDEARTHLTSAPGDEAAAEIARYLATLP